MTSRNISESQRAIQKCHEKCVICGWNNKNLKGKSMVEGCHIYKFSKEKEYDEHQNIIALCPNHHTEMDNDCFYIDSQDYTLHFFDSSNEFNGLTINIEYVDKKYLAHRQYLTLKKWSEIPRPIN
jgi:predicted restriction endonuclease